MTTASHPKRMQPKQSGPIRNAAASASPPAGGPQDLFTAAGAAVCGVLENGVRTAYAVIDDYMRRGQDAARGIFNDPNRRGSMSDEKSGFGGGFNGGFNPWGNPMAMVTEQWLSAMRAWSQAWSGMAPGGWPQMGGFPFAAPGGQARGVAVQVKSSQPVEVNVSLYPGTDTQPLTADVLGAEGFSAPPLAAPQIARQQGTVRVSVEIGAQQPSGRYRGLIRSAGTVAGEMIVVVG